MVQAILSGLIGVFSTIMTKVFMPIINAVLKVITKYVIAPLLNVAINLVNYFIGIAMYGIAIFLLALIDYAELIFRLLAGLEVDGMRLTLDGGKDGSSDLLVQLLRSEGIQQAFLSMVIVGIFLLVITTIFQMIKVEYTTEGSKNAKGPILNKAFKGVATLMLLPLLTIFGVFMGNQILGLIDTATKGGNTNGDQPTISGTLFVTAASEAYYEANEMRVLITNLGTAPIDLVMNIIPMSWNAIVNAWGADDTEGVESSFFDLPIFGGATSENRDVVESGFICQSKGNYAGVVGGYRYYYVDEVTTYYDISQINYLLLFFGSAMVLKTLYYACFGMVVRLFHCGILFVVSPMIIGISPINDGAFKNWTKNFIGKALSAYGVVMAMNIFFIVIKVLLSLDIEFTNVDDYMFGNELMVGLLKSIFVIGGCTMVEKFSKELGSYFGADDAVSAGKDLEKSTKESVKNAVKTVGTIALMATGVGGGAAMAAKGIAGAIKAKGVAGAAKGGMQKLGNAVMNKGQGIADTMGFGNKWEGLRGSMKNKAVMSRENQIAGGYNTTINNANAQIKADQAILNQANQGVYQQNDPTVIAARKRISDNQKIVNQAKKDRAHALKTDEELVGLRKDRDDFNDDANVEMRAGDRRNAISARKHMNSETLKNFGGWGAGFKEFGQSFEKSRGEAAKKGGDQGQQDYQNHQKIIANAEEAKYKKTHSASLEASDVRMQNLMIKRATEQSKQGVAEANKSNQKAIGNIENLAAFEARARANGDAQSADMYAKQLADAITALSQASGKNIRMDGGKVVNDYELTHNIDVNMDIINKAADEARKQGLSGDKLIEAIMAELNKQKGMTKQSLEEFRKAIKQQLDELSK